MPASARSIMGRGAVNQKGPQAAFLAALHAIRGAGRKLPVNLVLVAEGEEEIGSPHFAQVVHAPECARRCAKLRRRLHAVGRAGSRRRRHRSSSAPRASSSSSWSSSGEKWGRGPTKDVHSSIKARVDSPAWHLVQALTRSSIRRRHTGHRRLPGRRAPAQRERSARCSTTRAKRIERSDREEVAAACSTGSTTADWRRRSNDLAYRSRR